MGDLSRELTGARDATEFWKHRFREPDQVRSGEPNECLVATVSNVSPGRVLDLGRGEGADALRLAEQGGRSPRWMSRPPPCGEQKRTASPVLLRPW